MTRTNLVELSNESQDPIHASEGRSTADLGHFLVGQLVKAWGALALTENSLVGGLEQTVGHLVAVEVGREVFERHFPLYVAAAVLGTESLDGLWGRGHEGRRHRDLEHGSGTDV